ncbi:hypothetical protein FRACA_1430007 [Frankia canadensis]|uniref:Uncharacterized protein n=1 Tax=Frankia canadensis TaxID=1836972 RepID=A0A2I2KLK1_9ACTN|nr:hypothetical protein [Frankia canadensis]SNQ46526.1 hypothetical protein FRACA_1430007 [Frankia canadensis]SOU53816.1 hypothetical protein FRACA_1430007 [Frankia canadensis]
MRLSEMAARWLPRVAAVVFATGIVVAAALLATHGSIGLAVWLAFLTCAMTAAIRWVMTDTSPDGGSPPCQLATLPKPRRSPDGHGVGGRES